MPIPSNVSEPPPCTGCTCAGRVAILVHEGQDKCLLSNPTPQAGVICSGSQFSTPVAPTALPYPPLLTPLLRHGVCICPGLGMLRTKAGGLGEGSSSRNHSPWLGLHSQNSLPSSTKLWFVYLHASLVPRAGRDLFSDSAEPHGAFPGRLPGAAGCAVSSAVSSAGKPVL